MNDTFHSSDDNRSARPLKHLQRLGLTGPITLVRGGVLPEVTVAYETYGRLNERRDNAVLVTHAISGDSHAARHGPDDERGWWDAVVGPGRCIDTDRYFVICSNVLGGCRGTTGPNCVDPRTGRPYGPDFPDVTIEDMVDVQARLIEHLGVEQLLAVVGGSLGGHQALCWAIRYPEKLRGVAVLAASPRLTSQALAFDVVARNAILRDPDFHGGHYYDRGAGPEVGLAIARMLGHITYLSLEAMTEKFDRNKLEPRDIPTEFEKTFSVGSYLAHQGQKFVERFDANSYVTLSMAMDMFDLGATPDALRHCLSRSRCRWLVQSFSSDWLFPPFQSRQIVEALLAEDRPVSYCNIQSRCGHDGFLLEDDLDRYGGMIRAFLDDLAAEIAPRPAPAPVEPEPPREDPAHADPVNIFHARRLDYGLIAERIEPGTSVLDLGCGEGGLLSELRSRGHDRIMGVEIDEKQILACIEAGHHVVQADLNQPLSIFGDQQFDYVVLSQTLQALLKVDVMIEEFLRIGRRVVVSYPNFAYHRLVTMLTDEGRSPLTRSGKGLLRYNWYNSPNIRFFSIRDFQEFCADRGIRIHEQIFLDTEAQAEIVDAPNRDADLCISVISR